LLLVQGLRVVFGSVTLLKLVQWLEIDHLIGQDAKA